MGGKEVKADRVALRSRGRLLPTHNYMGFPGCLSNAAHGVVLFCCFSVSDVHLRRGAILIEWCCTGYSDQTDR
jgi:hypothetical protein